MPGCTQKMCISIFQIVNYYKYMTKKNGLVTGFILDVISVQTGTMVSVWASQRRRPKKWMIISVWNVKERRKAAQRNCTASAEHHTMSPSMSCLFFGCFLLSILH